jgi:hypothetical protein
LWDERGASIVTTLTGKIVDGKVVVDRDLSPEGAAVTVIVHDDDMPELSPEQVQELREAIADMERGDYITAEELLEELRTPISGR